MKELLDLPVLYLSKYIIENKNDYYKLLRAVTEKNAWEPWLLYMLDAVEQTALFTKERIVAIRSLMEKTIAAAKEKLPARAYRKDLIELIFHQPYTKVQAVVDAGIAERQTAAEYLKELEKIGILKSQKIGRETLYLNVKLYRLLSK
jgi:Fic family protein